MESTFIVIIIVAAILYRFAKVRGPALSSDPFLRLEVWAGDSAARVAGAPLAVALAGSLIGLLSGHIRDAGHFFGEGFLLFTVFAFANSVIVGSKNVRLWIQMTFLAFFFGTCFSLLLLHL